MVAAERMTNQNGIAARGIEFTISFIAQRDFRQCLAAIKAEWFPPDKVMPLHQANFAGLLLCRGCGRFKHDKPKEVTSTTQQRKLLKSRKQSAVGPVGPVGLCLAGDLGCDWAWGVYCVDMVRVAVYDVKSYDRLCLETACDAIEWEFHEFRLTANTAGSAAGCSAVCVFVNDTLDAACLRVLAEQGVKHIALRCAGYNNVDMQEAQSLGLTVTRVPAYSPYAVAEHSVALLLTLNRKIHRAYNRVREQNYSLGGLVGFDLHGKTVGIIGTGKIGQVAAAIFKGFGCKVLAFDKFPAEAWAQAQGVEYTDLQTLLKEAHVISLYVPLLPDTHYLIDAASIALMRKGVFIVNTSRGKLIHTRALIDALKSGQVGGVALDVYEEEQGVFFEDLSGEVIQDDELIRLQGFPNVLITAHQAFLTEEALAQIGKVTTTNLVRIDRGEDPLEGTTVQ